MIRQFVCTCFVKNYKAPGAAGDRIEGRAENRSRCRLDHGLDGLPARLEVLAEVRFLLTSVSEQAECYYDGK